MENSVKKLREVDKNILGLLYKLTNNKSNSRIDASSEILRILDLKQSEVENEKMSKDLEYCIERLIKGLASSRDSARLGFALLLTEILKQMVIVQVEDVLKAVENHLSLSTNQEKQRDVIFGQLFAYCALVRSGRLADHSQLSHVILSLCDLWQGKSYILNASYEILIDLFTQLSNEKFKENVWLELRKKLPSGWENCSADSLWPLLLCIRMFPDSVTEKYMKKNWGCTDIFACENFEHFKKMIRQTTSSLPVLHPMCMEFVAIFKTRKILREFWNAVVDENLFEFDQTEKPYVGFEMVKKVLQETPKKKVVKHVLSSKLGTTFRKCYMNVKHLMNPAATCLAEFLCDFVKRNNNPEIQIIILKFFLQPLGSVLSEQILKKQEVSALIQNLLPDAIKLYFEFLRSNAVEKKTDQEEEDTKSYLAILQIGTLVCHPIIMTDIPWRIDVIKFLLLHSFFTVKEPINILHCEEAFEEISTSLRESFRNAFYKAVNSLYHKTDQHIAPLEQYLLHLLSLTEYVDQLMSVPESVVPLFPMEKVEEPWVQMRSIVHKLSKQSKKDGKRSESSAFQALFLELGFHLFKDPEHISEVLEELHICCKKALHTRKHPDKGTMEENEPSWICVVVDILISLLSRSSHHLRCIVTSVFPLLCPFITEQALQQILSVINPAKSDDDPMLVDASDAESEIAFDSGSSSEESDSNDQDNSKVDDHFKKKVKAALGRAAEVSDAESIVLSDSEMFKLDDKLAEAFKSRVQTSHTHMSVEEKTMLHFRIRCLDLIMAYLKSEPPMHLVIQCIEPILAAIEYCHKSKHQTQLLHKTVSTLQILTKIKKFQHQDDVQKSQLKELLENLISKCHKETDMAVAKKLYTVCVFMVLCFRRLENKTNHEKKSKKHPTYMKVYLSALEEFAKGSSSNMFPQFFVSLMEACPDLAWNFIIPCKKYAFDKEVRIYKRTQCLGLIFEALRFSKGQNSISADEWLEIGEHLIPTAVEALKEVLGYNAVKPVYLTDLLDVIYTCNFILKEKTNKSLLENHTDLLPLLNDMDKKKVKKLMKKGIGIRRKLILALGGTIPKSKKSKSEKPTETQQMNLGDIPSVTEKKRKSEAKKKQRKKAKTDQLENNVQDSS